jgi:hypothetical protein
MTDGTPSDGQNNYSKSKTIHRQENQMIQNRNDSEKGSCRNASASAFDAPRIRFEVRIFKQKRLITAKPATRATIWFVFSAVFQQPTNRR